MPFWASIGPRRKTAPRILLAPPSIAGNVWAGNRDEASGERGSVVHIGLEENGQCVDRDGDNMIHASTDWQYHVLVQIRWR